MIFQGGPDPLSAPIDPRMHMRRLAWVFVAHQSDKHNQYDWLMHIDYIKEKSLNRLNLLRSLKFILNRQSLQKIYFTFIRPILEYADVVWDNCTQQQQNELEKIQLEAGRIVTGTTKLINIQKLYDELGWDKLSDRRRLHKLQLFYKMDNHLAPDYLCNLLPPHIGEVSSYPLRNADNYTDCTLWKLFSPFSNTWLE